ncbi:MAG: DUF2256 domain-containing protein [Hyphomicrobium sp.]
MPKPQSFSKKHGLPQKACAACGRPFAWRKSWARVWNEVKYCSNRCRAAGLARGGASEQD